MIDWERYLRVQNGIQPQLKTIYRWARELLPDRLLMSRRYFEAKRYLETAGIGDERGGTTAATQRILLARTLANALRHVPYYRTRVHIDPSAIEPGNALEMLQRFPVIDKQEVMRNPLEFLSDRFSVYRLIYSTSGGSTGQGIALWNRLDEIQVEQAFIEDLWGRYGHGIRSRMLRIGADAIVPLNQSPCAVKGRRLMVSPRHLDERWLPEIVRRIDEFQPEFIHAYPSCLELLAGHLRNASRGLTVKAVFLASEEVTPSQLDYFNEVFASPICFFYGAAESVLLGYGCYDGTSVRYHFNPLYGLAENIEDDWGHELVGTGLWSETMPLIRYRTQDYGRIHDGLAACAQCGRTLKTVDRLDGRRQGYLTTKQGTRFPSLSVSVDKFIWDYVSTFQFVQLCPGAIELQVVPRANFTPEVEGRILESQRARLSDWFEPITLVKVTEVSRTRAGKRRLVVIATD